ncbi:hypothetical protein MRX96_012850 [Rhipicephalus microplus]
MDPLKGVSKTKKRERQRRKSTGSATGELPRITSGIQKRRRSRGTIDNAQEMTLTVTQGSLLTRERKTDDEGSGTSAGTSKNAKGKRRRYFRDDSSAFAGPSKKVDAPTTHGSHKSGCAHFGTAIIKREGRRSDKRLFVSYARPAKRSRRIAPADADQGKNGGHPEALLCTGDDGERSNEDPRFAVRCEII